MMASEHAVKVFLEALSAYHLAYRAHHETPTPSSMDAVQHAGLVVADMYRAALAGTPMARVLHEVEAERCAQVAAGYDAAHDDGHDLGEIAMAAGMYAMPGKWKLEVPPDDAEILDKASEIRGHAVWSIGQERRKSLIIAAALAIAEVERMDRAAGRAA